MHPENPLNDELVNEDYRLAIATAIIASVMAVLLASAMVALFRGAAGWTYVLLAAASLLLIELLRRGRTLDRTEALHRRFETSAAGSDS